MRYFFKLILIVFPILFTGCFATKQDAVNIHLELRELRKEIDSFKRMNADLAADIEAQNVYLQAVSLGLGTVFVGAFNDEEVKKVLKINENEQPLCILPVGVVG